MSSVRAVPSSTPSTVIHSDDRVIIVSCAACGGTGRKHIYNDGTWWICDGCIGRGHHAHILPARAPEAGTS